MRYILKPQFLLRSYSNSPYTLIQYDNPNAIHPKADEYYVLLGCDGKTDLPMDDALCRVLENGWAEPCEDERTLLPRQEFREYNNPCVPTMEWAITNRCNQSCRHCYATATDQAQIDEFTWDECLALLDDCEECGIHHIKLTGGEPLLHPHFMDIIREMAKRRIRVQGVFTNGMLLTQDMLDEFKELGVAPLIAISFDGIGTHDWLRRTPGAEQRALQAIKLVVSNGLRLRVNMSMYSRNTDNLLASVELMDELGADLIRVIRVTESSRANLLMDGEVLSLKETADKLTMLARGYVSKEHKAELELFQFANLIPTHHAWQPAVTPGLSDCAGVCRNIRSTISVDGNGSVSPCAKMSGTLRSMGMEFGNIKTDGLKKLLNGSDYARARSWTLSDVRKNPTCAACEHLQECGCGCRAFALATTGDIFGPDLLHCMYFKGKYGEKLKQIFEEGGWH